MFSNDSQDYGLYHISHSYTNATVIINIRSSERLAIFEKPVISILTRETRTQLAICVAVPRLQLRDHAEDVVVDAGTEAIDADLVAMYLGYYNN